MAIGRRTYGALPNAKENRLSVFPGDDDVEEALAAVGLSQEQYQAGLDKWLDDPAYRDRILEASPAAGDLRYKTIPAEKLGAAARLLRNDVQVVPSEDGTGAKVKLTEKQVEKLRTIGVSREQFEAAADRSYRDPIYGANAQLAEMALLLSEAAAKAQ